MNDAGFRYLLDNNIVSDMVRNPSGLAATALAEIDDRGVCTSIIVVCELRFGVVRRGSAKLTAQVETVLSGLPILPLESPVEHHYGELRAKLSAMGQPIGYNDFFIAAHALALNLVLVTDHTREFSRVPNLILENWLASGTGSASQFGDRKHRHHDRCAVSRRRQGRRHGRSGYQGSAALKNSTA